MYTSQDNQKEILSRIKSTFPQSNLIPNYVDYPGQLRELWVRGPKDELFRSVLSEIETISEIAQVVLLLPDRPNIDSEEYFSFMSARIMSKTNRTYVANLQLSYVGICATLAWSSEKQERLIEPPTKHWEKIMRQIAEICEKRKVFFVPANDPFFEQDLPGFHVGIQDKQMTIYDALFFFEYC